MAAERKDAGTGESSAARARTRAELNSVIEAELIPRLMLAYGPPAHSHAGCGTHPSPWTDDATELARLASGLDPSRPSRFVEALRARGLSSEALLLEVIAPAATLLGEQWSARLRSFAEVSTGLDRLFELVQRLEPGEAHPAPSAPEPAPDPAAARLSRPRIPF